ncbi:hypothetical protein RFI_10111 [Reticulomyxa filosa]|uniref:Uncharacterized protein n=1 Tax=Reticulomyxa filosa TaxID=46433 RepID=X6NNS2_RETFI|nr:hypothetical protein RFI_10111 [Reticulomyxa filosa]|eukprot:ETO27022.1 hypothetical protein RFI_10111 [Reticulomyxa filosa]
MKSMNRNPVCYPRLPPTSNHVEWKAWDLSLEHTLLKLKEWYETNKNKLQMNESIKTGTMSHMKNPNHNNADKNAKAKPAKKGKLQIQWKQCNYFNTQLRAFELWLEYEKDFKRVPPLLPVIFQLLLTKDHRSKSISLISKYIDLGSSWSIHYILSVGIFLF